MTPKQALLQKSIRAYATNFMQENMMGLQNLPTEEQYAVLQQRRTAQIQRQIAVERQQVQQAQERERRRQDRTERQDRADDRAGPNRTPQHQRSGSIGWKPSDHSVRDSVEDPMLQQMEIIRGYIREAKQAQKWDEVSMLEQNLRDLKTEYTSQQKQTWET